MMPAVADRLHRSPRDAEVDEEGLHQQRGAAEDVDVGGADAAQDPAGRDPEEPEDQAEHQRDDEGDDGDDSVSSGPSSGAGRLSNRPEGVVGLPAVASPR